MPSKSPSTPSAPKKKKAKSTVRAGPGITSEISSTLDRSLVRTTPNQASKSNGKVSSHKKKAAVTALLRSGDVAAQSRRTGKGKVIQLSGSRKPGVTDNPKHKAVKPPGVKGSSALTRHQSKTKASSPVSLPYKGMPSSVLPKRSNIANVIGASINHSSKQPVSGPDPSPVHKEAIIDTVIPLRRKVQRRFYEPLLLLRILDPVRGQHIPRQDYEIASGNQELRKDYTNAIAYICDRKTGGDTVTAVALQKLPSGVVIWIAANKNIQSGTIDYLRDVLKDVDQVTSDTKVLVECRVFSKIIQFNKERLDTYIRFLSGYLPKCLIALHLELAAGEAMLEHTRRIASTTKWLESIPAKMCHLESLVRDCYEARSMHYLAVLAEKSEKANDVSFAFRELRHLLGRLGNHMRATKSIVAAVLQNPQLLENFSVRVEPSSPSVACPLTAGNVSLDGIVGRAFSDQDDIRRYRGDLAWMDTKMDSGLSRRLKEESSFQTRVHAELLLVDLFHRERFEFVDGEKYVGCSKPACYCCYHYMLAHHGGFSLPACHMKLYLCWRPPDIRHNVRTAQATKEVEDIMNSMNIRLRAELARQIESRAPRRTFQHDSTTGVTPSVDQNPALADIIRAQKDVQCEELQFMPIYHNVTTLLTGSDTNMSDFESEMASPEPSISGDTSEEPVPERLVASPSLSISSLSPLADDLSDSDDSSNDGGVSLTSIAVNRSLSIA
ncbi:MAG: hypothetical protein M1827_003618 [Pycnora praestabilis]|nr:MAG: hypothetical protein M1827_003618 [Pycnora praestabilis]